MISWSYDPEAGALYITLRELADGEHVTRTTEIDPGTMVDEDAEGKILGIEVLSPSRPWPLPEILRRWQISDEDQVMMFYAYPGAPSVSVT